MPEKVNPIASPTHEHPSRCQQIVNPILNRRRAGNGIFRGALKYGCKEEDGTKEYNIINVQTKTYTMCTEGKLNCQKFPMRDVRKSGIFVVLTFAGSSLLKIALQDETLIFNIKLGEFMEFRDNLLGGINSFGKCLQLR